MKQIDDYRSYPLKQWRSNVPQQVAEAQKAYPRHLPPVTAMDYESRIQSLLTNTTVLHSRAKYTWTVFRVASIILGSVMTTVYAANVIIVYDKETYIKDLIKKRDELL